MYVKRDAKGEVVQVSKEATEQCKEYLTPGASELVAFFKAEQDEAAKLRESDMEFVRVLEDVITLLMDKGILRFTDLPEKAQEKLLDRQSLRTRVNAVGLMDDDDSDVI
ncbi:tryptophan synthase subunit beta like protein [Vreelandella aquamarina]